jgi:hypothetical protein
MLKYRIQRKTGHKKPYEFDDPNKFELKFEENGSFWVIYFAEKGSLDTDHAIEIIIGGGKTRVSGPLGEVIFKKELNKKSFPIDTLEWTRAVLTKSKSQTECDFLQILDIFEAIQEREWGLEKDTRMLIEEANAQYEKDMIDMKKAKEKDAETIKKLKTEIKSLKTKMKNQEKEIISIRKELLSLKRRDGIFSFPYRQIPKYGEEITWTCQTTGEGTKISDNTFSSD